MTSAKALENAEYDPHMSQQVMNYSFCQAIPTKFRIGFCGDPKYDQEPIFTNILILRVRILLRIRTFSFLRNFLILEIIVLRKQLLVKSYL